MKVAAISDIHGDSCNLARAIRSITADDEIGIVLNCGDVGGYKIIEQLGGLVKEQYVVFSRPDLSSVGLVEACGRAGIDYFYDFGVIEVGGKKIGFSHEKVNSRHYRGFDVLFYGHLHTYKVEVFDGGLVVCCGEIMERTMPACYAVYDTQSGEVVKVDC
ncbi:MAG: metallophosphoesterase family protein [Planctomycetota bacterium]|jgi:putative phosphoesterase